MAWQFTSAQPIYRQLMDTLEMRIFRGTYESGAKLPSVRELASEASVNPNTMQRALSELERKGLVSTQRSSGRTVTEDAEAVERARREKAAALARTYNEQIQSLGLTQKDAARLCEEQQDKEEEDGEHSNANDA